MNTTTMFVGTALLLFGLYTSIMRAMQPAKLSRLAALKELFGDKIGNRIHVLAYSVAPLAAGAIFLFAGSRGASLF